MSLIYGYSDEKDDDNNSGGDISDLEKLVGKKTDDRSIDSAFGKIKKNKEEIATKGILLGSKTNASSVDSAFGRIQKNKETIKNRSTLLGYKANASSVDSAFGRIKKNKEDITASNNFAGSSSSLEGESSLKGTQLSHASAIAAHAGNLLNLEDAVGTKTDPKTTDTAFGRIRRNEENLSFANSFVGSSNSAEGSPSLKGAQLSHASAISSQAGNLLNLEGDLGMKIDDKTVDSAFGRIQKNKENIEKIKNAVELKETTGTFVAPLNDGKVQITGWSMTRYSTIIAIIIKAEQTLFGVSRVTLYSGTSWANNSHTMTIPMSLADMKLGRPAVIVHTKDPGHANMYANTRGNAIGSVGERTVSVKFVYIDHTTPILN